MSCNKSGQFIPSTCDVWSTIISLSLQCCDDEIHPFRESMVATYGLSGLKMNMLSGVTALAGFVSSASSFSDLQVSGSLLLTGEGQGEKKKKTRLGQVREGDEEDS